MIIACEFAFFFVVELDVVRAGIGIFLNDEATKPLPLTPHLKKSFHPIPVFKHQSFRPLPVFKHQSLSPNLLRNWLLCCIGCTVGTGPGLRMWWLRSVYPIELQHVKILVKKEAKLGKLSITPIVSPFAS